MNPSTFKEYEEFRRKNIRKGLLWLIVPWLVLLLSLVLYGVLSVVIDAATVDILRLDSSRSALGSALRLVLGLLGAASTVLMPVGLILGIVYLTKRLPVASGYDEQSGKGGVSVVPPEIRGWNWGAAGLSWIWGISNRVWVSLLCFVPVLNLVFWIWLGLKGNELAWRSEKWENVESFHRSQKKWAPWGIAALALNVLFVLATLLFEMGAV